MATRSVPKMYHGPAGQHRPAVPQHATDAYDWRGAAGALSARVTDEMEKRIAQVNLPATHATALGGTTLGAATLGDILVPERNSFGVMRFLLATAVLISHCFFLYYGSTAFEPLIGLTGYTLGQHAVQVFFFFRVCLSRKAWRRVRTLRTMRSPVPCGSFRR